MPRPNVVLFERSKVQPFGAARKDDSGVRDEILTDERQLTPSRLARNIFRYRLELGKMADVHRQPPFAGAFGVHDGGQ